MWDSPSGPLKLKSFYNWLGAVWGSGTGGLLQIAALLRSHLVVVTMERVHGNCQKNPCQVTKRFTDLSAFFPSSTPLFASLYFPYFYFIYFLYFLYFTFCILFPVSFIAFEIGKGGTMFLVLTICWYE